MEPLLLFPDPAPPDVAQALDLAGYPWKSVGTVEAGRSVRFGHERVYRRYFVRVRAATEPRAE